MGGVGRWVSNALGSQNDEDVQAPKQVYNVDKNAYEYGGAPGGAQRAADQYGQYATEQRGMMGDSTAQKNDLYGYGQGALNEAQGARAEQVNALNMAKSRAMGNDLISQRIAQQQQQQLQQQQASASASARGPAALALAQQNAANNTAMGQSTIANQAAISGAQEQLANQQAYANQAQGLRGTDLGAANTSLGAGAAYGGLGVAQGQLGLGYSQLQNNVQQSQLQAQMQKEAQTSANIGGAQSLNAQVGGQNASMAQRGGEMALGGVSSLLGAAAKSDSRAKMSIARITGYREDGGPVDAGNAYVVGENGPEVVVPANDGYVVPNTWGTATTGPADLGAAGALEASQKAENNRIANLGDNSAERQTLAGMPSTIGLETGTAIYGGKPLGASTDAQTQKGIADGMKSAGISNKEADKAAAKTADTANAQAAANQNLKDRLSGAASDFGKELLKPGGIDTSYHGGGGYVPVPVTQLAGARAMGGPVGAGQPYLMGEQGPETLLAIPSTGSGPGSTGGGPASFDVLKGGGMDVAGSFAAHNAADTKYQMDATSSPMDYSDANAKMEAYRLGKRDGIDEGKQRAVDNFTGTAGKAAEQAAFSGLRGGLNIAGAAEDTADKAYEGAKRGISRGVEYVANAPAGIARVVGPAYTLGRTGYTKAGDAFEKAEDVIGGPGGVVGSMYPAPGPEVRAEVPIGPPVPIDYNQREVVRDAPVREMEQTRPSSAPRKLQRREHGGPVEAGRPYIVGERQPEVLLLDKPQLRVSNGGQAYLAAPAPDVTSGASLSGPAPRFSTSEPMASKAKVAPAATRAPTNDELLAQAKAELAKTKAQKDASMAMGPAVRSPQEEAPPLWLSSYMARQQSPELYAYSDERTKEDLRKQAPMAAANRAQAGYSYAYKPEFTPPEQSPGEKNVGPMAQNLARDPIARTAVKRDPEDGMLMLDNNKLAKLHSAGIASLQEQFDDLRSGIARVLGRHFG